MTWRASTADQVRALIARVWLGARGHDTLGRITLRPHQRIAAARLRAMLASNRGALLADPVGLGKTYTALAAARGSGRLLIVAPAALRSMWTQALDTAGMHASFISYQALSRSRAQVPPHDVVIADEAHHIRNPATRRYRALARLCADTPVLLLSATPIHNRIDDLRAQLALFLGRRAWIMPERDLARHVIKRDLPADESALRVQLLPRVVTVQWLECGDDEEVLRGVMQLPAPTAVADGGDGGALVALSLVRQWASSRAALETALRTRLAQSEALMEAFDVNRHPTRAQLRAWCFADGALQLAFPQIATDNQIPDNLDLIDDASFHIQAVRELLQDLNVDPNPDDVRGAALRDIMRLHPDSRIVVFAEFAATVKALYARLVRLGGVAMLTGRGGFVSGGRITRQDLLDQFAPRPTKPAHPSRKVRLLITTDLFSEGVNLQGANVVVHADLPWSPARAEQRVGRVRRLGSEFQEVFVYALRPPASANVLLRLEERLRRKITIAARAVGVGGTIMPRLFAEPTVEAPSSLTADADLTSLIEGWTGRLVDAASDTSLVAAVRAESAGFVAVVDWGDGPTIVAQCGRDIRTRVEDLLPIVQLATGGDVELSAPVVDVEFERLTRWCDDRSALAFLELPTGSPDVARRRLLRRIDAIAKQAPRHLRARYLARARDARRAAAITIGAGAETVLTELAAARMPDDAWLTAVCTFADLHARDRRVTPVTVRALLLLVPTSSAPAVPPP